MLKRVPVLLIIVIGLTPTTLGEITEWGGAQGGYSIVSGHILITAPGTYKFQSLTNGELDNINSITVHPTCPAGDVNLYIRRDPNEVADPEDPMQLCGALNVDVINLSGNARGILREVHVANVVGADGAIVADTLTGSFRARQAHHAIDVSTLDQCTVDLWQPPFAVPEDFYLAVRGLGPHTGSVTIRADLAETNIIDISGDFIGSLNFGSG